MKKILTSALILIALSACAQDSLPDANRKALEYAKSKLGHRVGNGVCCELIDSALCKINPEWAMRRYKGMKNLYGERVAVKRVIPGDILLEDNLIGGHLAIVYKVDKDGVIIVLNQNVRDCNNKHWATYKNSRVVFSNYRLSNYGKSISFYRPR